MKRIVLFASGSGTNAENIIKYFHQSAKAQVLMIYTNRSDAGVIDRAKKENVPVRVFNREEWKSGVITLELEKQQPDLIVLAGFLWLVPADIVKSFPNSIINIHPALLPKYGGKGMFGEHVHQAVSESGETETGITIHYVNDKYDEGNIVFQQKVQIESHESADTIAEKVHRLEYAFFPQVIEDVLMRKMD